MVAGSSQKAELHRSSNSSLNVERMEGENNVWCIFIILCLAIKLLVLLLFILLLCNHGYFYGLNHIETKDYVTNCDKPEQNYESEVGQCLRHSKMMVQQNVYVWHIGLFHWEQRYKCTMPRYVWRMYSNMFRNISEWTR